MTEQGPAAGPGAGIAAYVDCLDAALVDGFLATFECGRLAEIAAQAGLSPQRLAHVHRGYFVAMAGKAWADDEIDFDDEAQLTMLAVALSIPAPEAIELVHLARDLAPPLVISGLGLTCHDRIAFAEPLSTGVEDWHRRAEAAGLTPSYDTRSARFVVTCNPNASEHADLWAAGVMVIAEWAFCEAIEELELQRRQRRVL